MLRSSRTGLVRRSAAVFVTLLSLAALACGGGGGSGDGGGGGTGSTSVFLTDAASDRFDEILVTITCLELLGNGAPVEIYSGRETIDLKDLEDFSDLFAYAEEVPVGTYNKIRMCVDQIELVEDGYVTDVKPPAHGKIDLLPKSSFAIREGIHLVIEIDMDAKKSIHYVKTGRGEYRFRPVVFVKIRESLSPSKLARIHGEVTEIFDDGSFELCTTVFLASRTNSSEEGYEEGGIGDRHRCMTVETDGDTGVFDPNGDPVDINDLMVGDDATVVGRFHMIDGNHDDMIDEERASGIATTASFDSHGAHHQSLRDFLASKNSDKHSDRDSDKDSDTDSDSDSDSDTDTDGGGGPVPPEPDFVFLAYVIEIGPPGAFLSLKGLIETEVDAMDEFEFALDSGQGFGDSSVLPSLLQDGTRIFSRQGIEVDDDEIQPDTRAEIDGVLDIDMAGTTFYKTALLVLQLELDDASVLRGEVLHANAVTRRLLFEVEEVDDESSTFEECIDVPEDTEIWLVSDDRSEEGDFDDLTPGLRADVWGAFREIGGCFVASTIISFPVYCDGSVECELDQFCGKEAGACDETGVCQTAPEVCPEIFAPVCGCDGVTYGNACEASVGGTSVASAGECEDEAIACVAGGDSCPAGTLCRIDDRTCDPLAEGHCVKEPAECPDTDKPVCGCDGQTYRNTCEATKAGAAIASDGVCDPGAMCGGTEVVECVKGEVCKRGVGSCEATDPGLCQPIPESCPGVSDPVCGCDGKTYDNSCLALQSGIGVESVGVCDDTGNICDIGLCAADDELAEKCRSFVDFCLEVEDEDECAGGALLICEGGPPDDVNPGNVCDRDLCADNTELADKCMNFFAACLANSIGERECLGGAFLICGELGI
jgi:hypothetical protein